MKSIEILNAGNYKLLFSPWSLRLLRKVSHAKTRSREGNEPFHGFRAALRAMKSYYEKFSVGCAPLSPAPHLQSFSWFPGVPRDMKDCGECLFLEGEMAEEKKYGQYYE